MTFKTRSEYKGSKSARCFTGIYKKGNREQFARVSFWIVAERVKKFRSSGFTKYSVMLTSLTGGLE